MKIQEKKAKTILRKYKKIDSWFISQYAMNIYRGCQHNCEYCDGRAEKYNAPGNFGEHIEVKTNAIEILKKEINPKNKKKPFKKTYMMVGGGVGDSYQPAEKEYELTRQALQLFYNYNWPVHILTKSTLVERDLDIIRKINNKNRAIVSFSFSSTNEKISSIFEPNVPSPKKRLKTIKKLKEEKIPTGMMLLPAIPFITDTPTIMEKTIQDAKNAGVDFIIFGGMTLKKGRQKDNFYQCLTKNYPEKIIDYENIYKNNQWGNPVYEYYKSINNTFTNIINQYKIPKRIPPWLFNDILDENNRVIVILEQLDYLLKLNNRKSPYGYAAYSISKINQPLSEIKHELTNIKGIGPTTDRIIKEILETKTSKYYEKLMYE